MIPRQGIAPVALAGLAACGTAATPGEGVVTSDYRGIETRLLDGDLVSFRVSMTDTREPEDLRQYAECAAARYALIRGYGFARHLRTTVDEKGGIRSADAVYTISPALPRGLETIDAEVTVENCVANGIPTV